MPRPGPRPYECVRRAWHSDRHQPLRGSIISQIFRVVTEAHSSATRKNREWQEKLPTVVIKAEEIMYSKANSEAEYLDTDTLWDRLNDAIDTIIRKEETVESGECLQPCIEAALVLGCVPVKASRSERLSNPRSYLHHHRVPDSSPRATAISEKPISERRPIHHNTSIAPSNLSSIARPDIDINDVPKLHPDIERGVNPTPVIEPNHSIEMGSVYPLCYPSTDYRNLSSHTGSHIRPNENPSNVIVGTPVGWSSGQTSHLRTMRELFPGVVGALQDNQAGTNMVASATECDLSLSLGRNFYPPIVDRRVHCEYEAGGSGRFQHYSGDPRMTFDRPRFQEQGSDPRLNFLPRQSSGDYFEGVPVDVSAALRKRKLPFSNDADEGSVSEQPQRKPSQFPGQNRWPGL